LAVLRNRKGSWPAIGLALAATVTWLLADAFIGAKYSAPFFYYWNGTCLRLKALLGLASDRLRGIIAAMRDSSALSLDVIFKDISYIANTTGEGFQWLLWELECPEDEPRPESRDNPQRWGAWLPEWSQIDLHNG